MNAELEKWIEDNTGTYYDNIGEEVPNMIHGDDLRELFDGKVLVPVDALREVIRISDRDHEAWDAVKAALAASQEQGK